MSPSEDNLRQQGSAQASEPVAEEQPDVIGIFKMNVTQSEPSAVMTFGGSAADIQEEEVQTPEPVAATSTASAEVSAVEAEASAEPQQDAPAAEVEEISIAPLEPTEDLAVEQVEFSEADMQEAAELFGLFEGGNFDFSKFLALASSGDSESDEDEEAPNKEDEPQVQDSTTEKVAPKKKKKKQNAAAQVMGLVKLKKTLEQFAAVTKLPIFDAKKQQELMQLLEENKALKAQQAALASQSVQTQQVVQTAELEQATSAPVQINEIDAGAGTVDAMGISQKQEDAVSAMEASQAQSAVTMEDAAEAGLESTVAQPAEDQGLVDPTKLQGEDMMSLQDQAKREADAAAESAAEASAEPAPAKKSLFSFGKKKEEDSGTEQVTVSLEDSNDTGQSVLAQGAVETDFQEADPSPGGSPTGKMFSLFGQKKAENDPESKSLDIGLTPVKSEEEIASEKAAVQKTEAELQAERERVAKLSKKEIAEEAKWAKEAERREKLLAERKEKRKKRIAEEKDKPREMKLRVPKKKQQSKLQGILKSVNYMGMEKMRVGFINNLGTMMGAGLPLLEAIRALEMETKNKQMKKILNRITTAIEMGSPLWRAMEAQYFFRPQQIAMVRVGEEAGNLVENLEYLAIQEEKDRSLRSKVKTAMIYPIIVLTMLTLIVVGLGMFVLPNLIQVIFSLGVPLPFVTRMIVKFTNLFSEHGTTILPAGFVGLIIFMLLTKYTSFKIVVQWFVYKIPGIGTLVKEATISRFGVVMGGLLRAGVPVTEALSSLIEVTGLVRYKKFYAKLLDHIKLGDSFTTSFRKIKTTDKCFPVSLQQLIVTGEKSGSLTEIMVKSAEIHEKKASEVQKNYR